MTKQSDGTWTITVSLSPGTYGYKFLVNGSDWVFDPKNPNRKTVDGVENSSIELTADSGDTSTTERSTSTPSPTPTETITPASAITGTTFSVTPGQVSNFDAPLSPKEQTEASRDGNPPVTTAKITLGVPNGFDPQRSYPLLVISSTVEMQPSSLFSNYQREAMDAGWVIMAADGPEKPKKDHGGWRWAMISAGMNAIESNWPAAKMWPVACGGFSGGAKRSGFMAARFANTPHKVIGMLMGGCNQDTATEALQKEHPPFGPFVNVPIYLSSGTDDKIATPDQHQSVKTSMKATGFNKIRLETYKGGHDSYPAHTTEALNWFVAESSKSSPARPQSDFDKFFKKKP